MVMRVSSRTRRGRWQVRKRRLFCAILYETLNVCQDRLGTNIDKVETRETFLAAGRWQRAARRRPAAVVAPGSEADRTGGI
jgi:hypothetical protein